MMWTLSFVFVYGVPSHLFVIVGTPFLPAQVFFDLVCSSREIAVLLVSACVLAFYVLCG